MTVSELLPCPTPFCSVPEPYIERVGAHLYKARCKYCQVETEAQFNEAAAVEQWNTRAMKAAEPLQQGDEATWDRIERVLWGVRDGSITPESAKQHIITAIGSQSIEGERRDA